MTNDQIQVFFLVGLAILIAVGFTLACVQRDLAFRRRKLALGVPGEIVIDWSGVESRILGAITSPVDGHVTGYIAVRHDGSKRTLHGDLTQSHRHARMAPDVR